MARKLRNRTGMSLAETAASMSFMLPVIMVVAFAVMEVSQAYMIKEGLSQAARQAARDLSFAYAQTKMVATDRNMQNNMVFNNIRVRNVVNASAQFDNAVFNEAVEPPIVTVTVHYTSNENGLPKFPNPDPLNIGDSLELNATSTYSVEQWSSQ